MRSDHATDDDALGEGFPQGTLRGYLTGFGLSVILTAIPFYIVMTGGLDTRLLTMLAVLGCAVAQMLVHAVFFLHMTPRAEGGWPLVSLFFMLILLVIVVVGTLWVMYHMDSNMMPGMAPALTDTPVPLDTGGR
ncbi:cytochrome o ubiquinol oxidase subunit IV [Paracoccus jeotgali]|uniref:Cytochrome bo(3) ubiquinol oxidase subunit 4 n=1 Tax=Paracoccus jeotgali TaxID=2065379 RepID=A0A2K9MGH9_9RHOB|nr:cytochrome o ubiquinol oxidase subunit IV [Paracoccus jeotgali]AUM74592.1 cytochrome o ubiquinol oxidase subunit IV [Paracoccus jeotgali]